MAAISKCQRKLMGFLGWKAQDEASFQRSRARDVDQVDQHVKAH